ncbi:TetR/AcrR family transcriptional regulator [Pontibacter sp. KCTC 32443]|uniref:TetR/AcrR family transcriptional regulator n=1 Tax=Pontibacter TaxID=323449 RepID=UPI00164D978C|nr:MULTISPECIES: TetR/AcrR family transcriptional regulator [Pontibacter]MBC5773354.1 TetR/AcrR family transcriptional regulator [Pontibacter sp. KCTC 32443]
MKLEVNQRREASKNLIIETALQLFSQKGFDKTSIRTIAETAGISLGLMYNYFKSKDELLVEIFKQGYEDIKASLLKTDNDQTPQTSIEHHIRQTIKILKEKKDFWKLLHGIRMQSEVVKQLVNQMNEQTSFIKTQIKKNLVEASIPFPDLEAKLLFASIDGMAHHFLLYDNYPIDDVATLLIMKYKKH